MNRATGRPLDTLDTLDTLDHCFSEAASQESPRGETLIPTEPAGPSRGLSSGRHFVAGHSPIFLIEYS